MIPCTKKSHIAVLNWGYMDTERADIVCLLMDIRFVLINQLPCNCNSSEAPLSIIFSIWTCKINNKIIMHYEAVDGTWTDSLELSREDYPFLDKWLQ